MDSENKEAGSIVIKAADRQLPNTHSRRDFLKIGGAGVMASFLAACGIKPSEQNPQTPSQPSKVPSSKETPKTESFKDRVLKFTWEQSKDPEQLKKFQEYAADEYLKLTQSNRVTREDLTGANVTYYRNTANYVQAVKAIEPTYEHSSTHWGRTHYESKKVFIDLSSLESQAKPQGGSAGMALLGAFWHEWGHLDVTPSTQSELINNQNYFISSPDQTYQSIRGAEVTTAKRSGFIRFNEVLLETITIRRIIEQAKLDAVISARDYYPNGVDFFAKYTQVAGISLNELYNLYATSNLSELWRRLGNKLPDFTIQNQKITDPLLKGNLLASGINENPQLTQATGVLNLIPNNQPAQKRG